MFFDDDDTTRTPVGLVPVEGRGSLPFALLHGESLVAVASWAVGEAGVDLLDFTASWPDLLAREADAGGRGSEYSDLARTNQRRLKIAKSSGSPAFGAAIRNHRRVFGEHRDECVDVSRSSGLMERGEQSPVDFRGRGKQAFLLGDVFPRAFQQFAAGRLASFDKRRDLGIVELEYVAQQQDRAFGRRQPL